MIKLELMSHNNLEDVFDFEVKNRIFFEKTLLKRPTGYFCKSSFLKMMADILEEQNNKECYMHIVRDDFGKMVGRMNVHSIDNDLCAEIGYRIAEDSQGKGYATESIKLIVDLCQRVYGLETLRAGTASDNTASQRVLEKNKFVFVNEEKDVMKINGTWISGKLFERNIKLI